VRHPPAMRGTNSVVPVSPSRCSDRGVAASAVSVRTRRPPRSVPGVWRICRSSSRTQAGTCGSSWWGTTPSRCDGSRRRGGRGEGGGIRHRRDRARGARRAQGRAALGRPTGLLPSTPEKCRKAILSPLGDGRWTAGIARAGEGPRRGGSVGLRCQRP
jgi:hypothetical protein